MVSSRLGLISPTYSPCRLFATALIATTSGCLGAATEPAAEESTLNKALLAEAQAYAQEGGLVDDSLAETTTSVGTENFQAIIDKVVAAQFPGLRNATVEARYGHSDISLLRTSFRSLDVARRADKRRYYVILSDAFATQPDVAAMEALVVHELQHVNDYAQMTGTQLLDFVVTYVTNPDSFVPLYERDTDIRALERGFATDRTKQADDMIRFREFLYAVLPHDDVQQKYRNYLLPEQIRDCDAQVRTADPRVEPCIIMTTSSRPALPAAE